MVHSEISPEVMYELICKANFPELQAFQTRDQSKLHYRHYPADCNKVLVLIHGIAEDGKYLFRLAEHLSLHNLAQVYTLDLRGYGEHADRRGDVDYIGQIDDDLSDFLHWIKKNHKPAKIVLGGHSFGGGSVLRFSETEASQLVDAYLFIAPYLHPSAPTMRKGEDSGHSSVSVGKLILLSLLEKLRIRSFHHWSVLSVHKPADIQHGGEALEISFRLAMSRMPQNYKKNLQEIAKPSLVLIGSKDEMLDSDKFDAVFKHNRNIVTKVLPNHNHDGILFSSETFQEVEAWLTKQ